MNVVLNTIAKTEIVWSQNTVDETTNPFILKADIKNKQKFMFAVSITGLNLSDYEQFFDISLILYTFKDG